MSIMKDLDSPPDLAVVTTNFLGYALTYEWRVASRPIGSTAPLSSTTPSALSRTRSSRPGVAATQASSVADDWIRCSSMSLATGSPCNG